MSASGSSGRARLVHVAWWLYESGLSVDELLGIADGLSAFEIGGP